MPRFVELRLREGGRVWVNPSSVDYICEMPGGNGVIIMGEQEISVIESATAVVAALEGTPMEQLAAVYEEDKDRGRD